MKKKIMKPEEYKILPTIQWVQPEAPNSLLLRSFALADEKTSEPDKPTVMFDEIFPAKNSIKKIENKYDHEQVDDTFHRAMAPVLAIGQFFGDMPVIGVLKPNSSYLKFSWMTWRVAFTLFSIAMSMTVTMMCILRMVFTGVDIFKTISAVFYGCTCLVLIIFLGLAQKWPGICAYIASRERNHSSQLRPNRRSLRFRIKMCCFAILFPALVEHLLSIFAGVIIAYDCAKKVSVIETFFRNSFTQMFHFFDYAAWKGILFQLLNLIATFNWNFMDLFIIVMSLCLVDRFDQLNERLEAVKGKHLPEIFWKSAREEYAHLAQLIREVDNHINKLVLLSFANNLYFICLQLFNSLNNANDEKKPSDCKNLPIRNLRSLINAIYFTFSFGLLMSRSLAVSLCAARIHSSSLRPASTLYAVPSTSYGIEVQRFLEQVVSDTVALTGLNFFSVTRGLVLTIAGTVVTYELVLVQFNSSPPPLNVTITNDNDNTMILKA